MFVLILSFFPLFSIWGYNNMTEYKYINICRYIELHLHLCQLSNKYFYSLHYLWKNFTHDSCLLVVLMSGRTTSTH